MALQVLLFSPKYTCHVIGSGHIFECHVICSITFPWSAFLSYHSDHPQSSQMLFDVTSSKCTLTTLLHFSKFECVRWRSEDCKIPTSSYYGTRVIWVWYLWCHSNLLFWEQVNTGSLSVIKIEFGIFTSLPSIK